MKVQKDVMDIVTTQRTNQQALSALEIQVGKLADHVEDVDDHLRGVTGESLDTRIVILERETKAFGNELRIYGDLLRKISAQLSEIKSDVDSLKFQKAIAKEADKTRRERFGEWLKFWGPVVLATLALIVPLAKLTFDNWDKVKPIFTQEKLDPEKIRRQIEKDRKGPRGRAVRKRERELFKPVPVEADEEGTIN